MSQEKEDGIIHELFENISKMNLNNEDDYTFIDNLNTLVTIYTNNEKFKKEINNRLTDSIYSIATSICEELDKEEQNKITNSQIQNTELSNPVKEELDEMLKEPESTEKETKEEKIEYVPHDFLAFVYRSSSRGNGYYSYYSSNGQTKQDLYKRHSNAIPNNISYENGKYILCYKPNQLDIDIDNDGRIEYSENYLKLDLTEDEFLHLNIDDKTSFKLEDGMDLIIFIRPEKPNGYMKKIMLPMSDSLNSIKKPTEEDIEFARLLYDCANNELKDLLEGNNSAFVIKNNGKTLSLTDKKYLAMTLKKAGIEKFSIDGDKKVIRTGEYNNFGPYNTYLGKDKKSIDFNTDFFNENTKYILKLDIKNGLYSEENIKVLYDYLEQIKKDAEYLLTTTDPADFNKQISDYSYLDILKIINRLNSYITGEKKYLNNGKLVTEADIITARRLLEKRLAQKEAYEKYCESKRPVKSLKMLEEFQRKIEEKKMNSQTELLSDDNNYGVKR